MARAAPREVSWHRGGDHPRPVLGQRRAVILRWTADGASVRGINTSTYLETKASRRSKAPKTRRCASDSLTNSTGPFEPEGALRRSRSRGSELPRGDGRRSRPHPQARLRGRSRFRPGPGGWQRWWSSPSTWTAGYGGLLMGRSQLRPPVPCNGIVGVIERRRQDDAVLRRSGSSSRTAARSGSIRVGDRPAQLCRPEPRPDRWRHKNVWEVVSDGLDHINVGRSRSRPGRMFPRSGSKVRTSRNRPACCPAVNATGSTWR